MREEVTSGVEHRDAEQGCDGGDEVGSGDEPELTSEPAAVRPVELDQRGNVDEFNHGGDHDRGEGGFGEVLEQSGEREQRDHGERSDDEPRELAAGAGGGVDGGL
jgi:hypothetical protein